MNQFKDYFTGKKTPLKKNVFSIQKCIRAGGKHNDLENVGMTARHHTFFEMMGNFSFGGYFKKTAIELAWRFLTEELKIPESRLIVSVYREDSEAFELWKKYIGLSQKKIIKRGDKDNFWEMGDIGPCGPCSEIYYDHGKKHSSGRIENDDPLSDESRFVEIWNLVFMEYEKRPQGRFKLPMPCIDTGAGLERIAAILQNVYWNYDTDLFTPLIEDIQHFSGKKYTDKKYTTSMRIVSDHLRSMTILATDGIIPSNEGRGYILRRIIRRAVKSFKELQFSSGGLHSLIPAVFKILGREYPQNKANKSLAEKLIETEECKFSETLEFGLKYLEEKIKQTKDTLFSGQDAFKLYDTFGLPLDLTETILKERGMIVDKKEFDHSMSARKEDSRKSWKGEEASLAASMAIGEEVKETQFDPNHSCHARLLAVESVNNSSVLIFDKTPFYGESGGQVGDIGFVFADDSQQSPLAHIYDTQRFRGDLIVHYSRDADKLDINQTYYLAIDVKRRQQITGNHTATHLLQAALIQVLGQHIRQAGSLVAEKKLRFDFTHGQSLTKKEMEQVENLVNEQIHKNISIDISHMNKNEAIKKGALAFFGERYGESVRVLSIGDFSMELCGGTHVAGTGHIGLFLILSEESVSSGIRRIEAITGETALDYLKERSRILTSIESTTHLKGEANRVHIQSLAKDLKNRQKEILQLKSKLDAYAVDSLFSPEPLKNTVFCAVQVEKGSDLRSLSDRFFDKYSHGFLFIYMEGKQADRFSFLLRCSKDISMDCRIVLKSLLLQAGGGRPDMAQGAGTLNDPVSFTKTLKEKITRLL